MQRYSYIISDGKRVDYRLRKSFSDFFWDTLLILIFAACIGIFLYLLFLLDPIVPIALFGSLGTIAAIAYVRYKIWDHKWRKENEVS